MKRFHITLAVRDLDASIADYSKRLGAAPEAVVPDTLAVWRTEQLNFTVEQKPEAAGQLLKVGFEDEAQRNPTCEADVNGIAWEHFSSLAQNFRIAAQQGVPVFAARDEELIRN